MKTDRELWSEILRGSNAAWGELVKRYKSLVYGVCTHVGLSLTDSADCFQQTWVLLHQNRLRINDPGRLSSWLVTTAKREGIRLKNRPKVGDYEVAVSEQPDPSPRPDEEMEQLEAQAHLEAGLKELDPVCRELLREFFFAEEERSYAEIAQSLGYSANTLGAKRMRCLDKLRRILQAHGYFEERKND